MRPPKKDDPVAKGEARRHLASVASGLCLIFGHEDAAKLLAASALAILIETYGADAAANFFSDLADTLREDEDLGRGVALQ